MTTEQKRRPKGSLCYKPRNSKEKNKTVIAIWPGERGDTWSIDRNITKAEWIALYDLYTQKEIWTNVFENKNETTKEAEPW